ncbi:MAG: class I SAM-dependent methyltransferase [Bacteroidota bacterium]|nr:class I SAM-dependent methyltransferase [Bacteroidota bacterium]
MSKKNRKVDSKEVGLEIGLILFKYFLNTEYLHYGLFTDGLDTKVANLAPAQIKYAEYLVSNIPPQVKTILDVGCGSGKFADELLQKGYTVDCVSPGTILTEHARKLLNGRSEIFQKKFEDVVTDKKYDMILFSESFQYINMDASFSNALKFLNPGGHIMICDFFKNEIEGISPLGGGHSFKEYKEIVKKYPVNLIKEEDITDKTAPTIDLVNKLSMEVIMPVYHLLFLLLEDRFKWIARFIKWKYKKKLEKIQNKHFKGERSGENFKKYKSYYFYLYQKAA